MTWVSPCAPQALSAVGLKATHGLVPYTGVMPIESTIDHTGPMTATVATPAAARAHAR